MSCYYPRRVTVCLTEEEYSKLTARMTLLVRASSTTRTDEEFVVPVLNAIHNGFDNLFLGEPRDITEEGKP